MTKNPFLNALAAAAYIVLVALFMFYVPKNVPGPDTVLAPITLISLFTFSAGIMGYIFVLKPLQLYLDGEKKAGVKLFLNTLASFGVITAFIVVLLFVL